MGLTKISGFFSYAHGDDVCGRLRMLRDDLIAEYRQLTGNDLELFLDRDDIQWGDKWDRNIEAGIDSSSFFIPVLSPLYFKSSYCCEKELRQFLGKVERENASELLLPIYYVGLDYAEEDLETDLIERVFGFQYEDWREVRFAERCTETYRRAVNRLAGRLAKADREIWLRSSEAEERRSTSSVERTGNEAVTEREVSCAAGGPEDRVFLVEGTNRVTELSDEFTSHVEEVNAKMTKIGRIVNGYAEEMNSAGVRGPKAMTALFSRLAADLDPVADEYLAEAEECSSLIGELDSTVCGVAARLKELQTLDSESREKDEADWDRAIVGLVEAASGARGPLGTFNSQVSVLKGLSRVLYTPLRKIERANTLMDGVLEMASRWS